MFQKIHEEDKCNICVVYLVTDASLYQSYSFFNTVQKAFDPLPHRFENWRRGQSPIYPKSCLKNLLYANEKPFY